MVLCHPGHSRWQGSYPSAGKQLVYFTAQVNWISGWWDIKRVQLTESTKILKNIKSRKSYWSRRSTFWSMEDPDIWEHTLSIIKPCVNTREKQPKSCILVFHKKDILQMIKSYRSICLSAKIYVEISNRILPEVKKILGKNEKRFRRNWPTSSQILTIHRIIEGICTKKSFGNTIVRRFLWEILFHTHMKGGANISSVWPPPKNCYNDLIQRQKSNGSFIQWWHWLAFVMKFIHFPIFCTFSKTIFSLFAGPYHRTFF